MLNEVNVDLHIHTCLSPCGSLDMSPLKIVREAVRKGLSIIAVTDHNSAENVQAVIKAAEGTGLYVIPGMEITTAEEVHVVSLFPEIEDVIKVQAIIFDHLQPGENDEDLFGMQVIANEHDEVEGMNKRLLIGATDLSINHIIGEIHKNNGLAIAAHIDRESYSIIGQLGFIPPELNFDCLEVSKRTGIETAIKNYTEYKNFSFITASDAHDLGDVGVSPTRMLLEKPDFKELILAIKGVDGRKILI